MDANSQALATALQKHQAGHLPEAEQLYRQILEHEPANLAAWHLLGRLANQVGHHEGAVQCLRQAIQLCPDYAEAHSDLGTVMEAMGKLEEAAASYRKAVEFKPGFADAHFNLGNVLRKQGHCPEAEAAFLHALSINPAFAESHLNLGSMLTDEGRLDEAASHFRAVIALLPRNPSALFGLGFAIQKRGNLDVAADYYCQALQIDPGYIDAQYNLATIREQQENFADAAAGYRRVLELNALHQGANNNLGHLLWHQGLLDEAETMLRQALRIDPNCAETLDNLAIVLAERQRFDDAAACFDRAVECNPTFARARLNRAHLRLLLGDFELGWEEYEWRWKTPEMPPLHFNQPKWDGESLVGKTILLYAEQGFGDTLQFIRYASTLKKAGASICFLCSKALIPLLKSCAGIDRIVGHGDELPAFDFYSPLLSLPRILKTRVGTIPQGVPYLSAEPARVEKWRARLDQMLVSSGTEGRRAEFRIGINWHGRGGNRFHRDRDISLARFAPLAQIPGVRLVNLQKGNGSLDDAHPFEMINFGEELDQEGGAFMDTAAIMASLDLIVTSDTAIPHLAGALGVPVWVALKYSADWRWMLGRNDSPWYPSMRLFRQQQRDDWTGVFAEVVDALNIEIKTHPTVESPTA